MYLATTNGSDKRSIKKQLLKNSLHQRCQKQKNLHVDLKKKIYFIRSRCYGITWFLLYKSIERNIKKLNNLTRNTMLPFQRYDVVANLSKNQLSKDEMGLLKTCLNFSIPLRFLKKTDVSCQFDMIAKFMTQELEDNQIATPLKNERSQMASSYQ